MGRRIVVLGAGPAGVAAALAARARDAEASITLVSAEQLDPYEKPPLSKAVLLGKALPQDAPIVPLARLAAAQLEFRRGAVAEGIDRTRQRVALAGADGLGHEALAYDALVLATGARVRQLPLLPSGAPGVHYLRNSVDAVVLRQALEQARRVCVVGAGLIGLEVAAAAAMRGLPITVVDMATAPMARLCTPDFAGAVRARHEAAGVVFRLGATVRDVAHQGRETVLTLDDGTRLASDVVVVGIGVAPDDAMARAAGLATDDGILVDERCVTSDPAIFAAGDVARLRTAAGSVRLENWRHALDQGAVAGANAAGGDDSYRPVPSFWSDQYELMIQGVGWPDGLASPPVRRDLGKGRFVEFHAAGEVLRYSIGIGAARDLAQARRLIERRTRVSPSALQDASVALAQLVANG